MAERMSFFAEQDKRRDQVWRLSALSFLLLLCAGMPVVCGFSIFVTNQQVVTCAFY